MSAPYTVAIRLFRHCHTGRRYVYVRTGARGRVFTKGDVLAVSGCSARYGRDRMWLEGTGKIEEHELSEGLMRELLAQGADQPPEAT